MPATVPLPGSMDLSDEAIVALVRAGDVALFEVLMRRHNQRLFRVARAITGDPDEAEDVMQEAYVRAFYRLDQFEGRARFSTWLTKIAAHEASARRRRRARARPLDAEMAGGGVDPGDGAAVRELQALIEAAVDGLPAPLRVAFTLREVEGLSTAEAAECLELSEDALKVRLHRARASLRREVARRLGDAAREVYTFRLARCDRVVARVFARIRAGGDTGGERDEGRV
ncbi:MAG: RNA polymerase sigma factor [Polyangiaceae bacterium]